MKQSDIIKQCATALNMASAENVNGHFDKAAESLVELRELLNREIAAGVVTVGKYDKEITARDLPENTRTWDEIYRAKALVAEFDKLTCQLGAEWYAEWYEAYDKLLAENEELKTEIAKLRKNGCLD